MRAVLVLAAGLIVFGILGMHALNAHGMTGSTEMTEMTGMTGMPGSWDASHHQQIAPASQVAASGGVVGSGTPGHGMGDIAMLCAAMIATAGITLLTLLLLRRVPTSSWAHTRTRLAPLRNRLVSIRQGTGPPSLWEFSVIRC